MASMKIMKNKNRIFDTEIIYFFISDIGRGFFSYLRILPLSKKLLLGTILSICFQAIADDTEIFTGALDNSNSGRPKVLIVFDDSGSMGTWVSAQRPEYDPNGSYHEKFPAGRLLHQPMLVN